MNALPGTMLLLVGALVQLRGAEGPPPVAPTPTPAEVGLIVARKVVGAVTITLEGETRPLKNDDRVPAKATLKTAAEASALLAFSNAAMVNLGADSELTLDIFKQEPFAQASNADEITVEPSASRVVLRLLRGDFAAQVKRLLSREGSSFNVATAAGVLSTSAGEVTFLVNATRTEVTMTVAEGEMNFRPARGEPTILPAGSMLRATVFGAELMK